MRSFSVIETMCFSAYLVIYSLVHTYKINAHGKLRYFRLSSYVYIICFETFAICTHWTINNLKYYAIKYRVSYFIRFLPTYPRWQDGLVFISTWFFRYDLTLLVSQSRAYNTLGIELIVATIAFLIRSHTDN